MTCTSPPGVVPTPVMFQPGLRSFWPVFPCLALVLSQAGCRTGADGAASCCGLRWPAAPIEVSVSDEQSLPPPPAPANPIVGMSAHSPTRFRQGIPQFDPADESSRLFPSTAPSTTNCPATPIAPLTPAATLLGPEPIAAPGARPVEPEPSPIDSRLAALEAECRDRLSAIAALESKHARQSDELAQVLAQLADTRGDVATLTTLIGDLHQRDAASLEQLSHTLDSLLESSPQLETTEPQ